MNQAGGPKGRTAAKLTVRERFHTVCKTFGFSVRYDRNDIALI